MNNNMKPFLRWPLVSGYLALIFAILACATITGGGGQRSTGGLLRLSGNVIEVQTQGGSWQPVAGTSTFEMVGSLENTNPWTVSGKTLETNASTQIEAGLETGDLVRVRGAILEDDTWLAYSIESADEQENNTIILIGAVTSMDPWVVNGITLNVTADTVVTGDIEPGTLVRVEILLLDDGTWEVVSISPVGTVTPTNGCVNVIATVVSVNGDQVQFLGWPTTVTLSDGAQTGNDNDNNDNEANENDGNENDGDIVVTVNPGQQVLAVVCVSDGQLVIVQIIVLIVDDDGDDTSGGGEKVLVCHKPEKKGGHTLSISSSAVPAHLGHGDKLGPCP